MRKKSIPCYLPNGGEHNVVNIPMGQFTRARLKQLCRELLENLQTFETMVVAKATTQNVKLIRGLYQILDIDYKPRAARRRAEILTSVYEKNLKPTTPNDGEEELVNLVSLAVSCGLITLLYLLAAHIEYLELSTI